MEEMLIEKVRERCFLYDTSLPSYRDQQMRNKAWEEIGMDLNMKPENAKDTWERLRRCFMNALSRRRNNSTKAKRMFPWKFESEMSFLLPTINHRRSLVEERGDDHFIEVSTYDREVDALDMSGYDVSESKDNIAAEKGAPSPSYVKSEIGPNPAGCHPKKRKHQEWDSTIQHIINVMKQNSAVGQSPTEEKFALRDMNETDMFFLSMARMTKKLPLVRQAKIKLQLSQSVLQAQIDEELQRPGSSDSSAFSS